jgi:hypothetical protein
MTERNKPCGHAAHVDFDGRRGDHKLHNRLDFFRGASLAAEIHMPTGPATTFASLENREKTARRLHRKEDFE